ncbi:hypothetical protein ASC61_14275 [Aeromicrobium sp. Root344]|uniref:hypothetical protein n=1 Tax=Aeromicrobium sp. Root344 TaxID=1736521 RepID=UPI0006F5A326|nr:hypothetical protein [Aeromicrobium sp. Root344]KQV76077.1 hypothetical protein ASC61_14275 [Aeromicrobium sp. Root344]
MPKTQFTVHTTLSPGEVLGLLTDFGPERPEKWPNIDDAHFTVHELGATTADVTEGNSMGWERSHYAWDSTAGTVTVDTVESNLWGPGSGWLYELTAANGGTDVHVVLTRKGNSLKGKLIGALIPVVGASALGKQLKSVLRKAEAA